MQSASTGVSFGGSLDCGSLEKDNQPWSLVAQRARSRFDMRPVKTVPRFHKHACQQGSSSCQGNSCGGAVSICSIDREVSAGSICGVEQFSGSWERVPVTVDSGAYDSIMPRWLAQGVPINQTEASRQGLSYRAANGTRIKNEGERKLIGYTGEGNFVDMGMQVGEVTKALGSARAMMRAGNRVVLDSDGSYVYNKGSGVKTKIEDRNGSFQFDIWVPRANASQGQSSSSAQGYQGKYFQALVEDEDNAGFARLDDLM